MNTQDKQTEFVAAESPEVRAEPAAQYAIRIANITREERLETGTFFLDVTIDVLKGEELLHTRKIGFPDGTPDEEIRDKLAELKASYIASERREAQIEAEKAAINAHLIGEVIS